jgi:uncharacterized protein with ParB-like and HNH nuclease domain
MDAKNTSLQQFIEGTKQFIAPLFQRTYSWDEKQWKTLWDDINELYEDKQKKYHFFGSIVSMPTSSGPEGVPKYLIIDGQQRLTTIFIILIVLRNKAQKASDAKLCLLSEEIQEFYLVNKFKKDTQDFFKLIPTQKDRKSFIELIENPNPQNIFEPNNKITKAYNFFEKEITKKNFSFPYDKLKGIIVENLQIVSIVLDNNDNPYLVFEGLNAKGMELTQADLVRNYIFMNIDVKHQDEIYNKFWKPMQDNLSDEILTEYVRHFLMMDGDVINKNDIYYFLKDKISPDNAESYIETLKKYSEYYKIFVNPNYETNKELQKYFLRLKNLDITTLYPLLLNLYGDYKTNKIQLEHFIQILKILENYLIRRYICDIPTNQLNKIFPSIYPKIKEEYYDNSERIVYGIKSLLQGKGYPKDEIFEKKFIEGIFYGSPNRNNKTKLILEAIEQSFNHKEIPNFDELSIEHIMPQTLSESWKNYLGENWEEVVDLYKDSIGNLTLSAYNTELSNADFTQKKGIYKQSNLELNKYFLNISEWKKSDIEKRTKYLAKKALEIWNYFGDEKVDLTNKESVTGTKPKELRILGQKIMVNSWRDVFENTLNVIAELLDPEKFEIIANNFSKYIGIEKYKFREVRQLKNGYCIEVNLSAEMIRTICLKIIQLIELTSEEWKIEYY